MSGDDRRGAWRKKAARAREVECVHGLVELEKYPNLDEILCGYVDDDGERVKGGSILIFVNPQGKITACVNLPGNQQQFWTDIAYPDGVFAELEESIVDGRGSFKDRDVGKAPPKNRK